jgi:hypothetical protein
MDWTAEACVAFSLLSWPFFPCPFSAFRTDSLVLAICDPLPSVIAGKLSLRRIGQTGNPKVVQFKVVVCHRRS